MLKQQSYFSPVTRVVVFVPRRPVLVRILLDCTSLVLLLDADLTSGSPGGLAMILKTVEPLTISIQTSANNVSFIWPATTVHFLILILLYWLVFSLQHIMKMVLS